MSKADSVRSAEKRAYPWTGKYTLKISSSRKITSAQYVLYMVQIAVLIILAYLSVVLLGPLSYSGISLFYFVYAFMLIFSMWWGIWGIVGSFIAAIVGSGLLIGMGVIPAIIYSFGNLVPYALAFIVYRGFLSKIGIDPLFRDLTASEIQGYKTHRAAAWGWFILINLVIGALLSTQLGVGAEYMLGLVPAEAYWFWWWGWYVSAVLATAILVPIVVRGLSSVVERQGLINEGWVT